MNDTEIITCDNILKHRTSHFYLISSVATYEAIIFLHRCELYGFPN